MVDTSELPVHFCGYNFSLATWQQVIPLVQWLNLFSLFEHLELSSLSSDHVKTRPMCSCLGKRETLKILILEKLK